MAKLARFPSTILTIIKLERNCIPSGSNIARHELFTFCDASEAAIAAVVYLKVYGNDGEVTVSFLISSSRVIPKSCASIPRAELCAALLGSKLYREASNELKVEINDYKMFSDSRVVLAYIRNSSKRFRKFVISRVHSILKLTNVANWNYINTSLNPADLACRPQTVGSLKRSVWLDGPLFLGHGGPLVFSPPCPPSPDLPETMVENKNCKTASEDESPSFITCSRVGTLNKAVGVMSMVLKFCKLLLENVNKPHSLVTDREAATNALVLDSQRDMYGDVRILLNQGELKIHRLAPLDPFIDGKGVLRVGGRLQDSLLSYDVKHPVLLSPKHPFSILLVRHYHQAAQHQGRHLTMGAIRSAGFFIERGTKVISRVIKQCITCQKLRGKLSEQHMSPLPQSRLEDVAPFSNCGLDVFGHFLVSESKTTRKTKGTKKMWGLLFTCMASRGIHVEALPGLDITSLANALRRFMAIRGPCRNFYSDRGTNFVGINNQTDEAFRQLKTNLANKDCTWHFNPPHASHFGGAWERKISAVRRVLEGILIKISNVTLNGDELATLFHEAAAVVNATPMWEISGNPADPFPISPSMILTMKQPNSAPSLESVSESDLHCYGAKRWRRVQYLADCFWKRWRVYYLSTLQERPKWAVRKRNVRAGDVVMIRNKNEKRNTWPMGIVESTKTSKDGLVRSATIKCHDSKGTNKLLQRPISELVLLMRSED